MSEKEAVREADDRFFAALNDLFAGSTEPMDALWSEREDVVYMGPDGVCLVGWPAIRADWERQAEMKLGGELEARERYFTIGSEIAVVHHTARGANVDADGNAEEVSIRGTNVFRMENGAWKMIAHHSDPLPYLKA